MVGENLQIALFMTLVGMTVVFAAIVLLWWMMAALVRLLPSRAAPEPEAAENLPEENTGLAADQAGEQALRAKAAAIAVAVAVARQQAAGSPAGNGFPLPPTAIVSAWQAVMRANNLNQRTPRRD